MQLEQMESVLRGVRSQLQADLNRKVQRESDDRFLAQRWWREPSAEDLAGDLEQDADGKVSDDLN